MREADFKAWMQRKKISSAVIANHLSRCRRVERDIEGIELDAEFLSDGGKRLRELLTYTSDDQLNGRAPRCGLSFSQSSIVYHGMASIRASVAAYMRFAGDHRPVPDTPKVQAVPVRESSCDDLSEHFPPCYSLSARGEAAATESRGTADVAWLFPQPVVYFNFTK